MNDYTRGTLPQRTPAQTTHWGWKALGMVLAMSLLSWLLAWIIEGLK